MPTPTRPLLPLLLVLAACASPSERDDDRVLVPGTLPTPYSAGEIRRANQPGTSRVYRIVAEGRDERIQTTTFTEDEEGHATFMVTTVFADGAPDGDPRTGTATWRELQGHASYSEADTERSRAHCTVAAGAYDCWLYERRAAGRDGSQEIHRFWFARDEPGPPVLYVVTRNAVPVFRMELLEVRRAP